MFGWSNLALREKVGVVIMLGVPATVILAIVLLVGL